ncbi:MAG: hypothetical protein GY711_01115 [bacterium]|nr:hypothetical protein [bacterium]
MSQRRAWALNLDAEQELAARGPYTRSASLEATVARARVGLIGGLVRRDDVVVDQGTEAHGLLGFAWCPTPRALASLERAGAALPAAPSLAVLRDVNARTFAARLAGGGLDKRVVSSAQELEPMLAGPSPTSAWLVRRPFGAAGRGRRRVPAARASDDDARWLAAGLRDGPLVVEPWVEVELEVARHGWIEMDGHVELGPPCVQRVDARGAWRETRRAEVGELTTDECAASDQAIGIAAEALVRAGYFGPFGVDAFRYRIEQVAAFQPLSEINARFTMGWETGMGSPPHRIGP